MFDSEFLELMPLSCELKPVATRNRYGEAAWGTSVMPRCHIQYTNRQYYSADGFARVEEGVCFLDGVYEVDSTWTLFIPVPGGANRQVIIQSVDQNTDEGGFHHTAVHFGAL